MGFTLRVEVSQFNDKLGPVTYFGKAKNSKKLRNYYLNVGVRCSGDL